MSTETIFSGENIYITKVLTAELEQQILEKLQEVLKAQPKIINFYLTSPGGYNAAGYGLIDFIQHLKSKAIPIRTIGLGQLASLGVPLFLMGDEGERYIGKTASLFFHQTGWDAEKINYKLNQLKGMVENLNHYNEQYENIVVTATHGKVSVDLLNEWRINEQTLSAQKALNYGIADHWF